MSYYVFIVLIVILMALSSFILIFVGAKCKDRCAKYVGIGYVLMTIAILGIGFCGYSYSHMIVNSPKYYNIHSIDRAGVKAQVSLIGNDLIDIEKIAGELKNPNNYALKVITYEDFSFIQFNKKPYYEIIPMIEAGEIEYSCAEERGCF